MSQDYQTR